MKVAIFEDEMHNVERLIQLLNKTNQHIEVAAIISSVAEGLRWLKQEIQVDLLLMDIQLSDGNCFELFTQTTVKTPIIFTTAYDNFALQAFKVNSLDYLLKPIELKELERALEKFKEFKPQATFNIERIAEEFMRRESTRFLGRINNRLIYVKAKDIAYLHFSHGITYAITHNRQQTPLDYSLDQIEAMLDKYLFFRINRQYIIQIDAIDRILTYHNNRYILKLKPEPEIGQEIIVSRERVADFKNWLEGRG